MQMSRLRDMATRGMKTAASTVSSAAAAAQKNVTTSLVGANAALASSPRPRRGGGYAEFSEPDHPGERPDRVTSSPEPRGFQDRANVSVPSAVRLAERLAAGAAAAEILFEMRVNSGGDPSGEAPAGRTAEEAETLRELRATCEDHLNAIARVVERGGVNDDHLLQRTIEVAESLVAAIGLDERPAPSASEDPAAADARDRIHLARSEENTGVVDLMEGLDVRGGGGDSRGAVEAPHRPSTEAEEEAMVAAAIAASLAEANPAEQTQPQPREPRETRQNAASGNLIDL
jgi:hypothetical protein